MNETIGVNEEQTILIPGDTCWKTARTDRMACIVDAADYFAYAKSALLQARHRVILVGWDFDTRIHLDRRGPSADAPDELGELLVWLTESRPELEIFILRWSIGSLTGIARGMLPPFVQNLLTGPRLHFQVDAAHPVAAAHHQKIAVVDDTLAFCGGIDMTVDRWDTSEHLPSSPLRVEPGGAPYGPWHDVTMAVDGEAARVISRVARDRWEAATGECLPPIISEDRVWPEGLAPMFTDAVVGVSRTLPRYEERDEVLEIRHLYLAAIAAARDTLYIESQYLASRDIAEALAARLAEPDGPEVVMVLPRHADGEIERRSMDGARHRLLRLIWAADEHDRFRAYFAVAADGEPIYVHAKVLIVDDRILRVGSSNLNNRSLGFDSECDVTLDAAARPERAAEFRRTILAFRTRLLAEHLNVGAEEFDTAVAEHGSLAGAVDALQAAGRTLCAFTPENTTDEDSVLAEAEWIDPEDVRGIRFERVYRSMLRRTTRGLRTAFPF